MSELPRSDNQQGELPAPGGAGPNCRDNVLPHRCGVKTIRCLLAICLAALPGCHACLLDRCDQRPFLQGSISDKHDYDQATKQMPYRPWYHFGSSDGWFDRKSTRHAAIRSANQALRRCYGDNVGHDFRQGFQQAFMDIANGGSGAVPAVPPPRYWSAPYRTVWGHEKADEWFDGYDAGGDAASQGILNDSRTVASSAEFEDDFDDYGAAPSNVMPYQMAPQNPGPNVPNQVPYPTPVQFNPTPVTPQITPPNLGHSGFTPTNPWSDEARGARVAQGRSPASPSVHYPNSPSPSRGSGSWNGLSNMTSNAHSRGNGQPIQTMSGFRPQGVSR